MISTNLKIYINIEYLMQEYKSELNNFHNYNTLYNILDSNLKNIWFKRVHDSY